MFAHGGAFDLEFGMDRKASSQVTWALLVEGVSSARLHSHSLQHMLTRIFKVYDHLSDVDKEDVSAAVGDLLTAFPEKLSLLITDLDRTSYALSLMGQTFLEPRLSLKDRDMVQDASQTSKLTQTQLRAAACQMALAYMEKDWMGPQIYNTNRSTKGLPPGSEQDDYPWNPVPRPESLGDNRIISIPGVQQHKPDPSGNRSADMDVALFFHQDDNGPLYENTRTIPEEGSEYGHPYMNQGHMVRMRRPFNAMALEIADEIVAESWTIPSRHRRKNNTETRQLRKKDRLRYRRNSQRRSQQKRWRQRNKNKLKRYHKDYNRKWRDKSKLKPPRAASQHTFQYDVMDRRPDGGFTPGEDDPSYPSILHKSLPDQNSGSPGGRVILDRSDAAQTRDNWRLTAAKAPFLHGLSPSVRSRAKDVVIVSSTKITGGNAYKVKGSDEDYIVRVSADGSHVACSCSFWEFGGPEYWAVEGGYLFGEPVGLATPPNKRDPKGLNRVCKHVYAVLLSRDEV